MVTPHIQTESEPSQTTFFEVPGLLLAEFDLAGQIKRVSDSWLQTFGYLPDEFSKLDFLDLIHPDDLIPTVAAVRKVRELGSLSNVINRYRRKDGVYLKLRWSAAVDKRRGVIVAHAVDITPAAREPADDDLDRLLPLVVESTPAFLYLYDLREKRFLYLNRRVTAALGYAETDVADPAHSFDLSLLHPEDRHLLDEVTERVREAADEQTIEAEYRFRHSDGTYHWFWNRCVVYARDDEGIPIQAVGSLHDITERKEREDSFRLLFLTSPHPMYVFDMKTLRFLNVNQAALELYGYTRDEFLTMSLLDNRPEDEIPRLMDSVRNDGARTQGGMWLHKKKTGEIIYARVWSTEITYLGSDARIATVIDETEKHVALKHLTEASSKLEAILHQSPVAVFATDEAGVVRTWNPAAEGIFSLDESTAIGTELRRLSFGRSAALGQIQASVTEGKAVEAHPVKVKRRDGETVELSVSARPLLDHTGKINGAVAVVADVTAKNQAERELKNLNQSLERRVAERTAEFEAANQELEAFCFSVAHDLRQPLRAIDGFSRAMVEDYGKRIGPNGREMLGRVRGAAQRLGEIMDALLALSRVTRTPLEREWVNLGEIGRQVIADLRQEYPDRSVEIQIDPVMRAYGDPRLLRLLVQNLLENGWKFTSKIENARIQFTTDLIDGHTIYVVRDNGAGIDMRYANKLFLPFERLHALGEYPGHGIGLATCQRVVMRHGGQISLVGAVGQGATALFTLQPGP